MRMWMLAVAGLLAVTTLGGRAEAMEAFDPAGQGGDLTGATLVKLKKLGREKADVALTLRLGGAALSAADDGAMRISGGFEQKGKGGKKLVVAHDAASDSALLGLLAGAARTLYAQKRGSEVPLGITVAKRKTVAKVKVKKSGTSLKLSEKVKFTATDATSGDVFKGSYRAKLAGPIDAVGLPDCVGEQDATGAALAGLGIDVCPTLRVDDQGRELAPADAPLGATLAVGKTVEVFFVGTDMTLPEGPTDEVGIFELVAEDPGPGNPVDSWAPSRLHAPTGTENDWAVDAGAGAQTRRGAAAADVDGDGLEEVVGVYMAGDDVTLRIVDDADAGFAVSEQIIAIQTGVQDVVVAGGDFDGDGTGEVAVALALADRVDLLLTASDGATFTVSTTRSITALDSGVLFSALATGNLDNDIGDEVAIVVNQGSGTAAAVAQYAAYDDAGAGFAELGAGLVRAEQGLDVFTAVIAEVAIGDVDADGRGELVLGGFDEIFNAGLGNNCQPTGHLLVALDDAENGFAPLATLRFPYAFDRCNSNNGSAWDVFYAHLGTLDVDGDGADEVHLNQFIYDDLNATGGAWMLLHQIPDDRFFVEAQSQVYDRGTSAMATGDVTGDGRDDLLLFPQTGSGIQEISIWSDDQVSGFGEVMHDGGGLPVPVAFANSGTPQHPLLVTVDVDRDGPVLKYEASGYEYVFTEPVVVAALAAAPCWTGVGQVTDACRTSYGTSETSMGGIDGSVTVSASAHVGVSAGFELFGQGVEAEVKETLRTEASFAASRAYTLERGLVFSTGPLEDAVVFTTIPYDRYAYRVASHPIAELVGEMVTVSLPRTPITLIAERGFFNRTVEDGSIQVDDAVFRHVIGDPRSYPSRAEKNRLVEDPFDGSPIPPELLGLDFGLDSDLVSVGQGGGDTTATVRFEQATAYRAGLTISYEKEVSVSGGGAMGGYSVGGALDAGVSWGSSVATTYSGTVGSLPAEAFAENQYSFGIFTHIHNITNADQRQFEVVNYWVE